MRLFIGEESSVFAMPRNDEHMQVTMPSGVSANVYCTKEGHLTIRCAQGPVFYKAMDIQYAHLTTDGIIVMVEDGKTIEDEKEAKESKEPTNWFSLFMEALITGI